MIVKVCQFLSRPEKGERLVQIFQPGDIEKAASFFGMGRSSAPLLPEVEQYLGAIKKDPNKIHVLVNALGAGEYWASNINGDYFPERALIHKGQDFGYETFYQAFPYKHHCFPAGTQVLMSDRTRKPIEEVLVGDCVVTLEGSRHVTHVMRRAYRGDGVRLKIKGECLPLVGTEDHPVQVFRREQIHCRCRYSRLSKTGHEQDCVEYRKEIGDPEFVPMSSVLPGDYLVLPKPEHGETSVPSAFARMVGWVASEGYLGKNGTIQFTFSENNEADIKSVTDCFRENGVTASVCPRKQFGTVMLTACSRTLHAEISEYLTGVLSEKTLTHKVLEWDAKSLLQLLGAYIDGDGHIPQKGRNSGQLRIRSSSEQMLRVLADIIRALDIPATVQWDSPVRDMVSPTNGKTYQSSGSGVVTVEASYSADAAKYSRKVFDRVIVKRPAAKRYGRVYLAQVTEVEPVVIDEDVYNLEVDGPHHYVAGEVVVHNCNKNPEKSFGRVELSVWNNQMKRVELVVVIDRNLAQRFAAQDVVDKIDQGMFPDVSMGAKVPYDTCSVCLDRPKYTEAQTTFDPDKHKSVGGAVLEFHRRDPIRGLSVTRHDYCEHLKNQLNKILPDGRKVYAINDYPKFFDISFVFIGADKTAKVMAKLASAETIPSWQLAEQMGYSDQPAVEKTFDKVASATQFIPKTSAVKAAFQRKAAEIEKEVTPSQFGGKAIPIDADRPDLPDSILDSLGKASSLSEALSTPTTMGIALKPREFQRITIIHLGKRSLADQMDEQGSVFSPTDECDDSVPMGSEHFSSVLKSLLLPHMEGRSCIEPVVKRKIVRIVIQNEPDNLGPEPKLASKADPFLQKIAAAYNGYLSKVVDCLRGTNEVVNQNSDLWSAVWKEGPEDQFFKTASDKSKIDPRVLIGAMGSAWLLSQMAKWQQRDAMMGKREPTGMLTDTVANNPKLLIAAAGLLALHQQGSTLPQKAYDVLEKFLLKK